MRTLYFRPVVSSSVFYLLFSLKRAARGSLKIQEATNRQKFAISAPAHNFLGLCLHN